MLLLNVFSLGNYAMYGTDIQPAPQKIKKGDLLSLIPHGTSLPDEEERNESDFVVKLEGDTYLDIIINFIYKSKRTMTTCNDEDISLFEFYFDEDSELVFNGTLIKKNKIWYLSFDS
jgi:hypothetical protein